MNILWVMVLVAALAILFFGIGVVLILINQRNQRKANDSQQWPESKGTVDRSQVQVQDDVFSSDEQSASQPMYSADVAYSYQVKDMIYTSDRISFGGKSSYSNRLRAEEIVDRYPEGSEVTVYFDPAKPQEAVLERTSKGSRVFLGAGISFIAVGVIILIVALIIIL